MPGSMNLPDVAFKTSAALLGVATLVLGADLVHAMASEAIYGKTPVGLRPHPRGRDMIAVTTLSLPWLLVETYCLTSCQFCSPAKQQVIRRKPQRLRRSPSTEWHRCRQGRVKAIVAQSYIYAQPLSASAAAMALCFL